MASFFGFGARPEIDIQLDGTRDVVTVTNEKNKAVALPLFTGNETVSGTVTVTVPKGKRFEHLGIKIELVGQIEFSYDRFHPYEFFPQHVRELEQAGELTADKSYRFEFADIEKNNESYAGSNVRLRYFLRAKIVNQYKSNVTKVLDFAVQNTVAAPELNNAIKMEVGIEDSLHIEFEYQRSKFHLKDVVVGKIYILLVCLKIKHMEIVIIKRESLGSGANAFNESENIAKFEIMDGAPVRGEVIPVRLYLSPYKLTPTYRNVHGKFSVRYYLNLVLVDIDDRRYFRQQEIVLWRNELQSDAGAAASIETL